MTTSLEFIKSINEAAKKVSEATGMSYELILAQAAQETGWGKGIIPDSNNIFNIKADSSWHGPTVTKRVPEYDSQGNKYFVDAKFRVYATIEESLLDRVKFLQENPRYSKLFEQGTLGNFEKEANVLQNANYATDPKYAEHLIQVYKTSTMQGILKVINSNKADPASAKDSLITTLATITVTAQKEATAKSWFETFSDSLGSWVGSVTSFMKEAASDVVNFFSSPSESLNKIDYQSNVEVFTVHRKIMRNLHKIVGITKSGNGEYIDASGITDGKLFDTKDKNFLKQILDSKSYVKFYSFLDEGSGNYQEFYIPIKNYNLIKDHLLVLDKDSKKMNKAKVSNFAIAYSAMLHLISPEVIGKVRPMENKQFPWIEEISSTPYYSTIHPLSRFVAKDNVINDPLLMMGYGYPSRMFKSNVLLARILQETNILPKNFSIIPAIEKSLKSGNREYCGTISASNPKGLLIVEKLHGKDFMVSKTYMKYCFSNQNPKRINGHDMQIINNTKKAINL